MPLAAISDHHVRSVKVASWSDSRRDTRHNWISNITAGDLVWCTLLQGILARCMQSTSNVPLWRLYAKQECCEGPSSDLEYEREILVYILSLSLCE